MKVAGAKGGSGGAGLMMGVEVRRKGRWVQLSQDLILDRGRLKVSLPQV